MLGYTLPLDAGHYVRYAGPNVFPCNVEVSRRQNLKRMVELPPNLIGWTTSDALVYRADKGTAVLNADQLAALFLSWENDPARRKPS
jgi:hypothetical protein